MRGQQERSGPLFSYVSTEERIPKSHPLRQVRRLADQALNRLNPTFCRLYPEGGRPSIPPDFRRSRRSGCSGHGCAWRPLSGW